MLSLFKQACFVYIVRKSILQAMSQLFSLHLSQFVRRLALCFNSASAQKGLLLVTCVVKRRTGLICRNVYIDINKNTNFPPLFYPNLVGQFHSLGPMILSAFKIDVSKNDKTYVEPHGGPIELFLFPPSAPQWSLITCPLPYNHK